jgi:hypothetical protein
MKWTKIATIVHVSDLHLFVDGPAGGLGLQRAKRFVIDAALRLRPPRSVRKPLEKEGFFRKFIRGSTSALKGFYHHDPDYLFAFRDALATVCGANHGTPLILVQSGDLEAYGGIRSPRGRIDFNGVLFWRARRDEIRKQVAPFAVHTVDLFGNHDVWPGTLPAAGIPWIDATEAALRDLPEFQRPMPDCTPIAVGGVRIEFYRVNTVRSGPVANTLAKGRIETDYPIRVRGSPTAYPTSGTTDPIVELRELADTGGRSNVIRVLVMHHPPHAFPPRGNSRHIWEGQLESTPQFVSLLQSRRFHFILSGHRHLVHPIDDPRDPACTPLSPHARMSVQPPLPPMTVQLVAGSPTQPVDNGNEAPSLSVYSLYASSGSASPVLKLDRVVYAIKDPVDADPEFSPRPAETIVEGLPL